MGRHHRSKEHKGRNGDKVQDHFDDGSCSRTRPFSYDEIMSKRKRKEEQGTLKQCDGGDISRNLVDKALDLHMSENDNVQNKDSSSVRVLDRYVSERGDLPSKDYPGVGISDRYIPERGETHMKESSSGRVSDHYISKRGHIRSDDISSGRDSDRHKSERGDIPSNDIPSGRGSDRHKSERGDIRSNDISSGRGSDRHKSERGDICRNDISSGRDSDYHKSKRGDIRSNGISSGRDADLHKSKRGDIHSNDISGGRVSDHRKSERGDMHRKDSLISGKKSLSERHVRTNSSKVEERTSSKDDSFRKDQHREIYDLETKAQKDKMDMDLKVKAVDRLDDKYRGRRQSDDHLRVSSHSGKKHPRDIVDKNKNVDRRIEKSGKDSKRKYQIQGDEKHRDIDHSNHRDEKHRDNDHLKHRDEKQGDNDHSKHRDEKQRDNDHSKYRDEKHRDNDQSKHDPEKVNSLESFWGNDRKDQLKLHYDDTRLKRRWSKSPEHENRKRSRSVSLSPKAHNAPSYDSKEHRDLSSLFFKERSGRRHSSTHKSTIQYNSSSSHHRKHGGSTSGLGGYSPRKRRTDIAALTPPPQKLSPEKKSAKWDVVPEGTSSVSSTAVPSEFQSLHKSTSLNVLELIPAATTAPIMVNPLSGFPTGLLPSKTNVSIDSIQLTQATRPMRRLYVENVPASASEKDMMQCLNNFLISSGVNHIKGTHPCISCIINKERGQAVIEFLTPEDALAALSFDGSSFSGSVIKIRRPKDFVDVATGPTIKPEKPVAPVEAISDFVKDSPYKIFIGGISRTLSAKMFMEIAGAFGPLKAYQFEKNEELDEQYAFLEYADQSTTLKACAGLNGMKLGGCVLTAVQALPNFSFEENNGKAFCGIPEHAKPLLEKPMQVLKLKNVFDPQALSALSDPEIEEIIDDVRLECSRYGMVKSVNLVKYDPSPIIPSEACKVIGTTLPAGDEESSKRNVIYSEPEIIREGIANEGNTMADMTVREPELHQSGSDHAAEDMASMKEPNSQEVPQEEHLLNNESGRNEVQMSDEMKDIEEVILGVHEGIKTDKIHPQEHLKQLQRPQNETDSIKDEVADNNHTKDTDNEDNPAAQEAHVEKVNKNLTQHSLGDNVCTNSDISTAQEICTNVHENPTKYSVDDNIGTESDRTGRIHARKDQNLDHIFEPACVFVEFKRTEASCMAAHSLEGRLFDDRVVTVEYVPLDAYRAKFFR